MYEENKWVQLITEENLIVITNITNTHPPMAQQFHFWGCILQTDIQSCAIMIKMIHCASLVTAKDEKQLKFLSKKTG